VVGFKLRWDFLELQISGRGQYVESQALRQFIEPILELQGNERVLDVGCGIGAFGKLIEPFLGEDGELIGIDIDPIQVAYGNEHWANRPNVHLEVGDANEIAYPDASFDIVAAMGLLEFVPDQDRVLREMARVLAPDGKLIVVQIDVINYAFKPEDAIFDDFWNGYLQGMRQLGIDLELTAFRRFCQREDWVLEAFSYDLEYRTQITEKMVEMVELHRGKMYQDEYYMRQIFEFNFQFLQHAGWTEERLRKFLRYHYGPKTFPDFLRTHIGAEFYQRTPFRVFRIHPILE